jgi:hypothetical protein
MADSYLRLIPAAVADAIMATVSVARKRFAVACANVAVEHCVRAGLGGDGDGELGFAPLREQVLAALEPRQIEEIDRMLGRREDHLYGLVAALRANDNEAPYSEFLRLATQRHTIRALRAMLLSDGLSAAARAAFETISATRNEQHIEELAREIMRPA